MAPPHGPPRPGDRTGGSRRPPDPSPRSRPVRRDAYRGCAGRTSWPRRSRACRLPAARLPFEDARVLAAMALTAVAAGAIRRRRPSTLAGESAAAALGLLPALVALRDSDLAAYHGVEHKAIGAYEKGSMDPADA